MRHVSLASCSWLLLGPAFMWVSGAPLSREVWSHEPLPCIVRNLPFLTLSVDAWSTEEGNNSPFLLESANIYRSFLATHPSKCSALFYCGGNKAQQAVQERTRILRMPRSRDIWNISPLLRCCSRSLLQVTRAGSLTQTHQRRPDYDILLEYEAHNNIVVSWELVGFHLLISDRASSKQIQPPTFLVVRMSQAYRRNRDEHHAPICPTLNGGSTCNIPWDRLLLEHLIRFVAWVPLSSPHL